MLHQVLWCLTDDYEGLEQQKQEKAKQEVHREKRGKGQERGKGEKESERAEEEGERGKKKMGEQTGTKRRKPVSQDILSQDILSIRKFCQNILRQNFL